MNYDERRRKNIIPNMPNASNDRLVGSGTSCAIIVPGEDHENSFSLLIGAPTLSAKLNPSGAITRATGLGEDPK
jgi:hypothetical protein